ncbi:amidase [Sphingobium sp.]|uniref:amidase n=1 Tax=Sphingobium sp. TaxID=1912891 RepID=UPI0028BEB38A|nr:amidase [Sphingobium sp.]
MKRTRIFAEQFSLGEGNVTVAVKDCIDIAGHRTACGSGALADRPPATTHAEVVRHLLERGARIVGKAAMHELAYGITGINMWFGTTPNPLFPDLISGGSSSGSAAAVAAGLVDLALGTDTGGSVRMPAACCGVFGFKPSFGRISRTGCYPEHSSLDCVGPFARDMQMLERGMALIDSGWFPVEAPDTLRLGMAVDVEADAAILNALEQQLKKAGVELVPVTLEGMEEAFGAGMAIIAAESWSAYHSLVEDPRMGDDVRQRLLSASQVTEGQVNQAEAVRKAFRAVVDSALAGVDALVMPTLPNAPPTIEELSDPSMTLRLTALVRPFNLTGHPALTIPVGTIGGRPFACQLVGRMGDDERLCSIGRVIEERMHGKLAQ